MLLWVIVENINLVMKLELGFGCVDSESETPDLIPNSEVKAFSGEGSARATWCENSKMHPYLLNPQRV